MENRRASFSFNEPLLTAADEIELAEAIGAARRAEAELDNITDRAERRRLHRIIRDGDRARDRFIRANLRLVISIARNTPRPPELDFDDVIQNGNLGLIRAVDKFDPTKGFRFSTYATWWIKQGIQRGMYAAPTIGVPGDLFAEARRSLMSGELPDDPRLRSAATAMRCGSINTPFEGGGEISDIVVDQDGTIDEALRRSWDADEVRTLTKRLNESEMELLRLRFGLGGGEPLTIRRIADELGVGQATVGQRIANIREQILSYAEAV